VHLDTTKFRTYSKAIGNKKYLQNVDGEASLKTDADIQNTGNNTGVAGWEDGILTDLVQYRTEMMVLMPRVLHPRE
jgi:hypothetical protein